MKDVWGPRARQEGRVLEVPREVGTWFWRLMNWYDGRCLGFRV